MRNFMASAFALCCSLAFCAAADFSVDGPTVELRRIQFCQRCHASLVVTAIPAGALIQCPRCDLVQSRIPTRHLLTKIFQVCPHCGARLRVSDFPAGSAILCGHCRGRQVVLPEAIWKPDEDAGTGLLPEAPALTPSEIPLPLPEEISRQVGDRHVEQQIPRNEVSFTQAAAETASTACRSSVTENEREQEQAKTSANEGNRVNGANQVASMALTEIEALAACLPPGVVNPIEAEDEEIPPETPSPALEESEGILPLGYRPAGISEKTKRVAADPFASDDLWQAAAFVNGEPLYTADLEPAIALAMEQLRLELGPLCATAAGIAQLQRCRAEARDRALQRCIDRTLLRQEAKRLGIAPQRDEIAEKAAQMQTAKSVGVEARSLLEEAEEEIIIERLLKQQPPAPITPAEVRDYYEKHRHEYLQPPRAALRSLTIFLNREGRRDPRSALEIARQIVSDLLAGATFEDMIRRYSEDAAAKQHGVMLFGNSPYVPVEFLGVSVREALADAKVGKVVGPIVVPGAIAFFKLEEWHEAKPLPFSAVTGKIQNILARKVRQEAIEKIISALRAQADIRIAR